MNTNLPCWCKIELLDSFWMTNGDFIVGNTDKVTVLLMEVEQRVVLFALENLDNVPETCDGCKEGSWDVANW